MPIRKNDFTVFVYNKKPATTALRVHVLLDYLIRFVGRKRVTPLLHSGVGLH